MNKLTPLALISVICIFLIGCKSTKDSFNKIADSVERISNDITPAEEFSGRLMEGIFVQLTKESTKEGIDSLSSNLSDAIAKNIDLKIKEINTAPLGSKLITGVKDGLTNKENQDSIRLALNLILKDLDSTITVTINNAFNSLTSDENKSKLSNLGDGIFNEKLSASLNKTINDALKEKIDLSKLGESLRDDILNDDTKDRIERMVPPQVDSILTIATRIVTKLDEGNKAFWEEYFYQLLIGILLIIGLIGYMYYINITAKKKNDKEATMNAIIMANINKMKNQNEYDELTASIWDSAIQHGIQAELKTRLGSLGLIGDEKWLKSKNM